MTMLGLFLMKANSGGGGGGATIALTAKTLSAFVGVDSLTPGGPFYSAAIAEFRLLASGDAESYEESDDGSGDGTLISNTTNHAPQWASGTYTASDYEVELQVLTGINPATGSSTYGAGTWNNLGTNRAWKISAATPTTNTSTWQVTIRRVSDSVQMAQATITMKKNN